MRSKFWGYIPVSESDFEELWDSSTIFLDANILLDLYRYTKRSRGQIMSQLMDVKERIAVCELTLEEFFKNRRGIVEKNMNIHVDVMKAIDFNRIKSNVQGLRHNELDQEEIGGLIKTFEESIDAYIKELGGDNSPDEDSILEFIIDAFEDRIISKIEEQKLEKIYLEGKKRYELSIPPGYEDKNKPDNSKYNDYVLWETLIQYSIESDKNIILVTEDRKSDWFISIDGQIKGPREELLNEFYRKTSGKMIYIYSTEGFIANYNKYFNSTSSQELVEEMGNLSKDRLIEIIREKQVELDKMRAMINYELELLLSKHATNESSEIDTSDESNLKPHKLLSVENNHQIRIHRRRLKEFLSMQEQISREILILEQQKKSNRREQL